jgi:predicted RNA methylase
LSAARHNAGIYGVADRITFVVGDAVEAVRRGRADLLFVDPPWGADWDRARTGVSALPPLSDVLEARGDRYAESWLKLPPSFDPADLPGWTFRAVYGVAKGDERRVKFVLAVQKRP